MFAVRFPKDRLGLFGVVCVLLLLAGCGSKNPTGRTAISGTVTLDGVPLDRGSIKFEPVGAAAGSTAVNAGAAIDSGEYRLPADNGLLPGKYRVAISSPEQSSSGTTDPAQAMAEAAKQPGPDRIPAKYNVKSELEIEFVKGGTTEFPFELISK